MKHIRVFLVLSLLISVLFSVSAEENDLIATHRKWTAERYDGSNYLNPQEKVLDAVIIVSNGMREPEAVALLEELSGKVPALKSYIKWLASGKPDPLQKNTIEALAGLKDYAASMWPYSWARTRCDMAYLAACGNVRDVDDEWAALIADYESRVDVFPDKDGRGLVALMKAIRWCQRTCRQNYDYPTDYPEVFEIEKQALDVYPPGGDDKSLQAAEVYYWLGEMKAMLNNDLAAAMLQSEADFNLSTEFMPIGIGARYPCNSLWYFKEATRIASEALNPGHPFVRMLKRSGLNFEANVKAFSPELWADLEEDHRYVERYYPSNTIERASTDCLWYIRCMQNGVTPDPELSLKKSMDILEKSLGLKNPIFHQHLFQTAGSILFINPDDKYWFNRLTSTFEKSGIGVDSDLLLYYFSLFMQQMHAIDPDNARERMETIYEEYLNQHSSNPVSVLTGLSLADYYLYNLFDNAKGRFLLVTVLLDLTTPFDLEVLNHPQYWDICLRLALNPDMSDLTTSDDYFSSLLGTAEISHPVGRNLLMHYLKSGHAMFKASAMNDCAGAAKLIEDSDSLIAPWLPDTRINSLTQLAYYKYSSGESFEDTEPLVQKAIAIYNSVPKESLRPLSVQNIGSHYFNNGRFPEALEWYEKALELYRMREGEHAFTTDYLSLRQDLAATLETLGRYSEARLILDENTDALTQSFGVTVTPDLLKALWQEYETLQKDNVMDIGTLMPRLQQITELTTQLYAASGYDLSIRDTFLLRGMSESIFIIAINYDRASAEKALQRGGNQWQDNLTQLETLVGQLEEWLGEIRQSNPYHEQDFYYHNAVNTLASYYLNVKNDPRKALDLLKPNLTGELSFDNIGDYRNAMNLAWQLGDTAEAIRYADFLEAGLPALKGSENVFMDNLTQFRMNQYIGSKEYEKALPYARDYFARHKKMLDGNFKLMTKLQQENYMTTHGDPADPIAGLLEYLPDELAAETYDAILYRTGMQLRSHRATRDMIEQSGRPDLKAMLDSVEYLHLELAKLGTWPVSTTPAESLAHAKKVGEMQHKSNRMEQRLLAELSGLETPSLEDISWTQVRDCLKPDEAAVEFLFSNKHIHALILRSDDASPRVVRLCTYDQLNDHINSASARNSASRAKRLYLADDATLYRLLWQPLESQLDGASTIYCSIPGILSTLAFNAFATPDGGTLFDRYRIVQLTTTGQLVFGQPESTPERIAIMADILYDENQTPLSPEDPGSRDIDDDFDFTADLSDPDSSRALKKSHFRHLPFTAIEMEEITRVFPAASVDSVRRLEASEPMLRSMVEKRPEVLHLATHGYYISSESDISPYPFLKSKGSGNMQRSGIALAGAEKTWTGKSDAPDEADGILTASEVAALDLSGTSLVALSACETALGDYSFEGIFGLQRGFKQAGAKSLLVSLWSVNDRSTSLFMSEFYRNLREGASRFDAWRRAVERVREDYPEPYYWAPFILLDAV